MAQSNKSDLWGNAGWIRSEWVNNGPALWLLGGGGGGGGGSINGGDGGRGQRAAASAAMT